jgi:ADP-ribosylglycohydrolase
VPAKEAPRGAPPSDAIRVLAHARQAVVAADGLETALRAAVLDTHEPAISGAIAGALAGARHGLRDVPAAMINTLRRRDLIDNYVTRVLGRRVRNEAGGSAGSPRR